MNSEDKIPFPKVFCYYHTKLQISSGVFFFAGGMLDVMRSKNASNI